MILFVSGRTDIPAYYAKWFANRVEAGFVDTRNPHAYSLVSRIYFKDVELILFCSKYPRPLLEHLPLIDEKLPKVAKLFQITVTPYKTDLEPVVGSHKKEVIEDIKALSVRYGRECVYVRFDPIIKSQTYTIDYHIRAFKRLMDLVGDHIEAIVISFLDVYKNTRKNASKIGFLEFEEDDYKQIGLNFASIAHSKGVMIFTCSEKRNLSEYGFDIDFCLSEQKAASLIKRSNPDALPVFKKQTARELSFCHCVQMVDIGEYCSCPSKCLYCYANFDEDKVVGECKKHLDNSSLLIGKFEPSDKLKIRH